VASRFRPGSEQEHADFWGDEGKPNASPAVSGPQFSETMPKKKAPTQAERKAAQASKKRSQASIIGNKVKQRAAWEASPSGQTRSRDIVDHATDEHNAMVRAHPEAGLKEVDRIGMTPNQLYDHYGFNQEKTGPGVGERQLPGMEDPHAQPQPKRWEEHTPEEQDKISRAVKLKTGATMDTMTRDLGSQLDQANIRARSQGASKPYASDFYTSGEPARVLKDTARRTGTPLGLVAAVNADTSPLMKFRRVNRTTGEVSYPNAEQAEHAIRHVQAGGTAADVSKEGLKSTSRTGFDKNLTKATNRADQVINQGKTVSQTSGNFGPKTAAYHNSWLPTTPDFLVSDRHTGHGALAHVSPEVTQAIDKESGQPKTRADWSEKMGKFADFPVYTKSPVEDAVATTGFHAMADHAMRTAMDKRGLGKVRQAQGAQWGEEQLQRGESGSSKSAPKVHEVYPPHPSTGNNLNAGQFHDPNQGSLF
jgi:hypothetical protein